MEQFPNLGQLLAAGLMTLFLIVVTVLLASGDMHSVPDDSETVDYSGRPDILDSESPTEVVWKKPAQ